jgi:hypothetical protein
LSFRVQAGEREGRAAGQGYADGAALDPSGGPDEQANAKKAPWAASVSLARRPPG